MQIQLTTDYAIRMLTYLTEKKSVASSTEMADCLCIPHRYVLRVGERLKKAKFVNTIAGPFGGYVLSKSPEEISFYDIILVIEGSVKFNRCLEDQRFCSRNAASFCTVHEFCQELQNIVEEKLKSKTLVALAGAGTLERSC